MHIAIITNFPQKFEALKWGVIGRAIKQGYINIEMINIFNILKKNNIYAGDDKPYGGGAGMILSPKTFDYIDEEINMMSFDIKWYMSPRGMVWSQKYLYQLNEKYKHMKDIRICILCGLYEGIDQRIINHYQFQEISIGDYILCGGELAAMVIIESLGRLIPHVINSNSLMEESFSNGRLEYDLYTRPEIWRTLKVPPVLLSGHHKRINQWKIHNSIQNTLIKRPNLHYSKGIFNIISTILKI